MDVTEMVTLTDAAEIIGLSPRNRGSNLRALCRQGKVEDAYYVGSKNGGVWLVPRIWAEKKAHEKEERTFYAQQRTKGEEAQNG